MYPVQRGVRYITGDAALLDDEAAHKLLVVCGTAARSTEWTVPHTLETSCAEASTGSYGAPRGVTR